MMQKAQRNTAQCDVGMLDRPAGTGIDCSTYSRVGIVRHLCRRDCQGAPNASAYRHAPTERTTGVLPAGHVSGRSWLALLYLIGPGSLLAMTCYVIALRNLPTATVSTYAYVNPVVAVALGWLLLGERLTLVAMLGGAVVLVSVVLLLTSRSRGEA